MRPIVPGLLIGMIIGLVFLGIADRVSNEPNSDGFPFSYVYWVPGCAAPGFACRAWNPVLVGIDYIFWLILAFALVLGVPKGLQVLARK